MQISHPGVHLFRGDVISNMEDSLKSHVIYRDEYNCVGPGCPQVFSAFADG